MLTKFRIPDSDLTSLHFADIYVTECDSQIFDQFPDYQFSGNFMHKRQFTSQIVVSVVDQELDFLKICLFWVYVVVHEIIPRSELEKPYSATKIQENP